LPEQRSSRFQRHRRGRRNDVLANAVIGFAIAELLDEGTKVVVPDRNAVPANAALTALGERAKFYLLDFILEDGITVRKYRNWRALSGLHHRHKRS
jgi:hypothetical protein